MQDSAFARQWLFFLTMKFVMMYDVKSYRHSNVRSGELMKFLFSWLKEYIDVELFPQEIAKILTAAGLEVDACSPKPANFTSVVVGRVVEVYKHPNADKLQVAEVTDGTDSYQVVCGAPNCRKGIKVAFAKVGAVLEGVEGEKFKIKKSKIRGVESFGMLCSKAELHLSDESDGIIEFSDHIKEGSDVAEMYTDYLFEISLTPNLGHCMSLHGIAQELSAAIGCRVKLANVPCVEDGEAVESFLSISVKDTEKCPRYTCRLIRNVAIQPSPQWMQDRLLASGIRPSNVVVDIGNYVALEMGQPLHMFDFDKIQTKALTVRTALDGEVFTTLDGRERALQREDLLICDGDSGERAIALAGVMGGLNTEVSETSKNILLESAYFQAASIRRTSKRLGLQSDSSKRFERNGDPEATLRALNRAAQLLQELAGGRICAGVIDTAATPFLPLNVTCRISRVNAILGTHLSLNEIENIFTRLGFDSNWDGKDLLNVSIPTSRADLKEEIDLIEEVARIYGYDNIPKSLPNINRLSYLTRRCLLLKEIYALGFFQRDCKKF